MRRMCALLGATALVALGAVPAQAMPSNLRVITQTVVDGSSVAFSLRPAYDAGGGNPLALYIGYAESNVSSPDPEADGQGSWYNLNIVEAAAFNPPENCTPDKNVTATENGITDVQNWVTGYVDSVMAAAAGQKAPPPPVAPGPRHACTERFPGFAQSRYPSTGTIPQQTTDNYFDKPAYANSCRQDPSSSQCDYYKQYWPSFSSAARTGVRDGSFSAASTDKPSQDSEALLFGAGDGTYISIGLARSTTSARMEGGALVTEATETMRDVCIMRAATVCALTIDQIRQYASVRLAPGAKPQISRQTTVLGVHGTGVDHDVTASDLHAEQGAVNLSGYFQIQAVSDTHACDPAQADALTAVADTGGLLIGGKGPPTVEHTPNGDVTVPGGGGWIMIGGACARARLDTVSYASASVSDFTPGVPSRTITIPGTPAVLGEQLHRTLYGAPQVITKQVTHVFYREAIAWRTAPYWASILGALGALLALGVVFRRAPAVAPAVRFADRFARQFLRG